MQACRPYFPHSNAQNASELKEGSAAFLDLPTEIWHKIFDNVDYVTLPHLSLVCRAWAILRFGHRVREEVMAFHRAALAILAIEKQGSQWLPHYEEMKSLYPFPNDPLPYTEDMEVERQGLVSTFSKASNFNDLTATIRKANDWLVKVMRVPLETSIENPPLSQKLLCNHERVTLFTRLHEVRDAKIAKQRLNRIEPESTIKWFDLLMGRYFSIISSSNKTDLVMHLVYFRLDLHTHLRFLEYLYSKNIPDKTTFQNQLLKLSGKVTSKISNQLDNYMMEVYRSYIELLPRGLKRGKLQAKLFLARLQRTSIPLSIEHLESRFVFELDDLLSTEKQRLCCTAVIVFTLQGQESRALNFLEKITSPKVKDELTIFLDHCQKSSLYPFERHALLSDFVELPKAGDTYDQEFVVEPSLTLTSQSNKILSKECRQLLKQLSFCQLLDFYTAINTAQQHGFLEEFFLGICHDERALLFITYWIVNEDYDRYCSVFIACLVKTLCFMENLSRTAFECLVRACEKAIERQETPPAFDFHQLIRRIGLDGEDCQKAKPFLNFVAHHALQPNNFVEKCFDLLFPKKIPFRVFEAFIQCAPKDLSSEVYKALLNKVYTHCEHNFDIGGLRKAVLQHHPLLCHLPEAYYDLSDDLLFA